MVRNYLLLILTVLLGCSYPAQHTVSPLPLMADMPAIEGKPAYLQSPFVTAGNRVYMIGNQDGSFSDLGWHITGEMGGIWDHPIKLLDGLSASLTLEGLDEIYCLDSADQFVNYPVGNEHRFDWKNGGLRIQRFQFVPDDTEGVVIQYKLSNISDEPKRITLCLTVKSDLRPTWLADSLHIQDGHDEMRFDTKTSAIVFKDQLNPWFAMVGAAPSATSYKDKCPCLFSFAEDNGTTGSVRVEETVPPYAEVVVPVYIAGSFESEDNAAKTLQHLRDNAGKYLVEKVNRFHDIRRRSAIHTPDTNVNQMYAWLKYNIDWLVREVPGQGTALSAGLPDYPWWFGADATYSLQGVLATGDHELVKSTIQLLNKISKRTNSSGRIIHEVSTNGVVYNRGNVNETAQFITLVYNYFQWTGDRVFIEEIFPDLKKGIDWLTITKDPDGNGFPNGSGMMEIPGLESELEMIDVAVYTQQALASAARLASFVGEKDLSTKYHAMARALAEKINTQWWVSNERSYGDFRSTAAEGNDILKAALIRSDTMKKKESVKALRALQKNLKSQSSTDESTYLMYHNWVVNTPMETGVATTAQALAALQTSLNYQNAYGLFVTGIDKTEEPDSVVLASRKKIFSYTGAVMTLPTGVSAVGAARYGQVDLALASIKKLERSFSYALPGSMYEVSPDFGMITQAWNLYGVAVPLVSGIFGIAPNAPDKSIRLTPELPTGWDHASIEEVRAGNNLISVFLSRDEKVLLCEITQTDPTWIVEVDPAGLVTEAMFVPEAGIVDGYRRFKGKKIKFIIDPRKRTGE